MMKAFTGAHTSMLRATKGRFGAMGGRVLLITTIGRRSGKQRTNPVMFLEHESGGYFVAASYAGHDKHPAWFLNLRENPDVEVERDGVRRPMRARIAEGEERATLWGRFVEMDARFAGYESKTDREIPVVVLES